MKNIHYNKTEPDRFFVFSKIVIAMGILYSSSLFANDFYFDSNLLQGSSLGMDMTTFNNDDKNVVPGVYFLDVYVNDEIIATNEEVTVKKNSADKDEQCLNEPLIKALREKTTSDEFDSVDGCLTVPSEKGYFNSTIDLTSSRLNISIPQSQLIKHPRGYIPVSLWDEGSFAVFLKHNTNFTRTDNSKLKYHYDYLWSNINSGTNVGLWQIRHVGNLRYSSNSYAGSQYKYNTVRTWVQRPIETIESVLSLGDIFTGNSLFGSLSFNGVKLEKDNRMLPQSSRSYAPQVRGVAGSAARVVIRQQGSVIYETSVPPGPFVINDLYNTKSQGDLLVEVVDADGKVSNFTVPYASVPESIRPGNTDYSFSVGRVRNFSNVKNEFAELTLQQGLSNMFTMNSGLRIANKYQALLFGGVIASKMGAFGINTTYSHAKVERNQSESGWRFEANYSKSFETGTNLVLATYRYSTNGFRDLQDVLGVRRELDNGEDYWSDTLKQKNKISLTVSQSFDAQGTLSLYGSIADYYGGRGSIKQLQLSYGNDWHDISYSINVSRQQSVMTSGRYFYSVDDSDYDLSNNRKYIENTVSLNLSIPLNIRKNVSNLSLSMSGDRESNNGQLGLSGSAGENSNTSYSLYAGAEKYKNSSASSTWGGAIQQNTSLGSVRGNISGGGDYKQYGAGYSGTIVAHSGGITVGPYVSDTFAIIHAAGAKGAVVQNGQGATIDRFGYAIYPSMSPYQYNNISLDPKNIDPNVELKGGSQRVVPYSGAIPKIEFESSYGYALLITTLPAGELPPMGAEVFDKDGKQIGMVGQGGQIYARVPDVSGTIFVKWGQKDSHGCNLKYAIPTQDKKTLSQLNLSCDKA